MDIEQIRSVLTNEIHPRPLSELDENELASVLVVIYGKEPFILMTEKAKSLKVHGGEVSFPGGKWCAKDQDLLETAIRETEEELCLQISKEQVIGQLDNVITLNSKYKITVCSYIRKYFITETKFGSKIYFAYTTCIIFEDNGQRYQSRTSLY